MFSKLKKFFAVEKRVVSDSYITYNKSTVEEYKKKYSVQVSIDEVKLPKIENVLQFEVQEWYHSDGDQITNSTILCKIQGGNLTFELEALQSGFLYFRQRPNVKMNPGDVVCLILSKKVEDSSTST